jgi:hypothetical protein
MNGKGSKPRPVDKDKFNKNFEIIFGKKKITSIHINNKKGGKVKK